MALICEHGRYRLHVESDGDGGGHFAISECGWSRGRWDYNERTLSKKLARAVVRYVSLVTCAERATVEQRQLATAVNETLQGLLANE